MWDTVESWPYKQLVLSVTLCCCTYMSQKKTYSLCCFVFVLELVWSWQGPQSFWREIREAEECRRGEATMPPSLWVSQLARGTTIFALYTVVTVWACGSWFWGDFDGTSPFDWVPIIRPAERISGWVSVSYFVRVGVMSPGFVSNLSCSELLFVLHPHKHTQ